MAEAVQVSDLCWCLLPVLECGDGSVPTEAESSQKSVPPGRIRSIHTVCADERREVGYEQEESSQGARKPVALYARDNTARRKSAGPEALAFRRYNSQQVLEVDAFWHAKTEREEQLEGKQRGGSHDARVRHGKKAFGRIARKGNACERQGRQVPS